jgi:hypothetical protein
MGDADDLFLDMSSTPEMKRYWIAMGRFVDSFSVVEHEVHMLVRELARLKRPYAQILLSGVRIDTATGFIKRLGEARHWSLKRRQAFDVIAAQLGEITRLRNDILHYGGGALHPVRQITNIMYAQSPEKVRVADLSSEILLNAWHDLAVIGTHISVLRGQKGATEVLKTLSPIPPKGAWLYKPEPQSQNHRKPRGTLPKCPRRPKASHP